MAIGTEIRPQDAEEVWDGRPGGKIVARWTDPATKIKYVLVEFKHSPGEYYTFFA